MGISQSEPFTSEASSGSEDMVVRRIFESEREEETSDWRKMYNEKLHTLYSTHRLILLS
jgi:hypothetical protein